MQSVARILLKDVNSCQQDYNLTKQYRSQFGSGLISSNVPGRLLWSNELVVFLKKIMIIFHKNSSKRIKNKITRRGGPSPCSPPHIMAHHSYIPREPAPTSTSRGLDTELMPSCGAAQRSEESHGFVTARVRTLSGARGTLQLLRLAVSYAALRHLRVCVRACVREAGERAHTPPRFVSLLPGALSM